MATQKFIQYYLSKIHELKDEKMLEKKIISKVSCTKPTSKRIYTDV